jgi:hypothetical protein
MGKGIAKEFKYIFPEMFEEYQHRCETKTIDIGKLYLYRVPHKWVLNFPTKKHWRNASKPEYIEAGLKTFVGGYARNGITSIAFPRLGCGNGELDWESQVRPLMERYLGKLPIDVYIHHYSQASLQPEHHDIESTKRWLRSEPENLGFNEVWDDLVALIRTRTTFVAVGGGRRFCVSVAEAPDSGLLVQNETSFFLARESLMETWQCLRSSGFIWAESLVDGLDAHAEEVMSLFSALPYVQLTPLSQSRPGEQYVFRDALQFIPRSRHECGNETGLPQATPM